ncbi:MAG TPA: hypothetical protein DCL21_03505 [Alphaproteobacteria bacterium]|nr:hypothetical protein [Alphaproteobacteria bacterium]
MNKNTAYSFLLSAVFVIFSVSAYNVAKVDYNDPQLLIDLIDVNQANAETATSATTPKKGKSVEKLVKQCKTCHTFKENKKNKTGPNLFAIYMKKIAENDTFKYSKSFKNANIVWNDENLDSFLKKPNKFIPKTKMAFNGMKKPEERQKVIDYLKNLK